MVQRPFPHGWLRRLVPGARWWAFALLAVPTAGVARAVEASPHPVAEKQPDGTPIRLYIRGNEHIQYYEDADGYTVVRTPARAYAYVSPEQPGGRRVASDRLVGKDAPPGGALRHSPPPQGVDMAPPARPPARVSSAPQRVAPAGAVRNIVVLMRFADHAGRPVPSPADFDVIFNHRGPHPTLAPSGSVRDVYLENSYGRMELRSTVAAWVTLPHPEKYYANGVSGLAGSRVPEAIRDALQLVDRAVDFRDFDADHDGWVDAITFVHSGYGAEWGGKDAAGADYTDRVWSHRSSIPTWTSAEGVRVSDYNINPGLWSTSGADPGRIGVISHELGHFFGLPDLYDTDKNGASGIGSWCLMANSWGFDGSQLYPPQMSAWCKSFLGWVQPTELTGSGNYALDQAELPVSGGQPPRVYKVSAGYPVGEYLLIENRQPVGTDRNIPAGGLAIWHVDEYKGANDQAGFPGQEGWPQNNRHYMVALLQADGRYDLERDRTNRGDAGDLFRAGSADRVGPDTVPSTNGYQNGVVTRTGHVIRDISAAGARMTFQFEPAAASPPAGPAAAQVSGPGSELPLVDALRLVGKLKPGASDVEFVRTVEAVLAAGTSRPAEPPARMAAVMPRLLRSKLAAPFGADEGIPAAAWKTGHDRTLKAEVMGSDNPIFPVQPDASATAGRTLRDDPVWAANQRKLWDFLNNNPKLSGPSGGRVFGGRRTLPGEYPHCVAVGSKTAFGGSGTLIGPNVVVTAGHCLDFGLDSRVLVGLDWNNPGTGRIYNVAYTKRHPDYDSATLKNDIALLILEKSVEGVTPCPVAATTEVVAAPGYSLVGFGYDNAGLLGSQSTVWVAKGSVGCEEPGAAELHDCFPGLELVAGGGGADTCQGDSGGPAYAYVNGGWVLAGVTSRPTKDRRRLCGDGGIYGRADVHKKWLFDHAAANGGRIGVADSPGQKP